MRRQRFGGVGQGRLCRTGSRLFGQELARLGLGLKQLFDFLAQRQVRPTRLGQERGPLPRVRNFHRIQEDVLDCLKLVLHSRRSLRSPTHIQCVKGGQEVPE